MVCEHFFSPSSAFRYLLAVLVECPGQSSSAVWGEPLQDVLNTFVLKLPDRN